MNLRNWLRWMLVDYSATRLGSRAHAPRSRHMRLGGLRPRIETLEDRWAPATISFGDATVVEGNIALKFVDRFIAEGSGGLAAPVRGSTFGPDGNNDGTSDFYLTSVGTNAILRYDGKNGSFLDAFVTPGSGGLNSPGDLAFGPDGMLYVSSFGSEEVLRYNGATGSFVDRIASGLSEVLGLNFGNDGALYIANSGSDEVLRYNSNGLSVFVSAGSGGLDAPRHAVFGPDGNLYVASGYTKKVLRYDGQTGAFLSSFASTDVAGLGGGPIWIEFGADGYLYATARTTATCCDTSVVRFNATNGAYVDSFNLGQDGWSFIVGPDGLLYGLSQGPESHLNRVGPSSFAAFTVSLDSPSSVPVTVNFSTTNGTAVAGTDFTAVSGTITFAPGQTSQTIIVKTLDDSQPESTETFTVNLSNVSGATIADGQGVGSILDNEVLTQFYVVNDAGSDQIFGYGSTGAAQGVSSLAAGNTAPRGATNNVAGDRLWIADANKTVYVYSPAGARLLGRGKLGRQCRGRRDRHQRRRHLDRRRQAG
jgi:hypothetical protein